MEVVSYMPKLNSKSLLSVDLTKGYLLMDIPSLVNYSLVRPTVIIDERKMALRKNIAVHVLIRLYNYYPLDLETLGNGYC